MMHPTVTDQFQYSLKFQVLTKCVYGAVTFLTEHEVINRITFCALHDDNNNNNI